MLLAAVIWLLGLFCRRSSLNHGELIRRHAANVTRILLVRTRVSPMSITDAIPVSIFRKILAKSFIAKYLEHARIGQVQTFFLPRISLACSRKRAVPYSSE